MRIIAGQWKGRRLATPTWSGLRPTSDKLRETLFNIVAPRIAGAHVLDACAGTGALGIEALSRGAASVTFIESDPRAAALIRENLRRCAVSDRYAIIPGDIERARPWRTFDLILLDPPYELPHLDRVYARVAEWLAPGGLLMVEHARRTVPPPAIGALTRVRDVRSGDSGLALFERRPGPTEPDGNEEGDAA